MSKQATVLCVSVTLLVTARISWTATVVQGDVWGDWEPEGNPYNVVARATIPPGQVLRIHPGVRIAADPAASLEVDRGEIEAIGSEEEPIVFESLGDSQWAGVSVLGWQESPPTSVFQFCEFHDAETAISFKVEGHISNTNDWTIMGARVSDCYFAPTVTDGISGEA